MPTRWDGVCLSQLVPVFPQVFQDVRNWTSCIVSLVQEVSQHLRPFWVFPLDVRSMIILWCNPVYLQSINRACFPEPEEGPAAARNVFAQNPWPALPESFLLKGSSALCFLPWLCTQPSLGFAPAAVSPNTQVLWTFLSVACRPCVVCAEGGRAPTRRRCMSRATQGEQTFHVSPSSTKMLWTWTNWASSTAVWPCPPVPGTGMTDLPLACDPGGLPFPSAWQKAEWQVSSNCPNK